MVRMCLYFLWIPFTWVCLSGKAGVQTTPPASDTTTLRIVMTGLITYGPMVGVKQETKSLWALLVEHDDYPKHIPKIYYGCSSLGCAHDKPLKGFDVILKINGAELAEVDNLEFDPSFRLLVGDLKELAALEGPMGHHSCRPPYLPARFLDQREPLKVPSEFTKKTLEAGDQLHGISSRILLAGGDSQSGYPSHWAGRLRAVEDENPCGRWRFPASNPRCAHLADSVVYELKVKKTSASSAIEILLKPHPGSSATEVEIALTPGADSVVEIKIVNSPNRPVPNGKPMHHFRALYDLFPDQSGNEQLPYKSIPIYDPNGYPGCESFPGIKPVKCPGFVF